MMKSNKSKSIPGCGNVRSIADYPSRRAAVEELGTEAFVAAVLDFSDRTSRDARSTRSLWQVAHRCRLRGKRRTSEAS